MDNLWKSNHILHKFVDKLNITKNFIFYILYDTSTYISIIIEENKKVINYRRCRMLLLKDRALFQVNKVYIEYNHKGDIDIYILMAETMTKEAITLYAHDSKKVIDFIFDSIVAEVNAGTNRIVDADYIVNSAYE